MGVSRRLSFSVFAVLVFTMFLPMALFPQKTQGDSLLSGISSGKTRVVDLSYAINDKLVPWPGDEKWFEAKVNATVEKNGYFTRSFWMLEHYGTHLDAPIHFPPGKSANILRGAFGDPTAVRYAEVSSGGQIVLAVLEYPGDVRCVWEIGNVPQATRTWFDEELTVYGSAQTVTVQFPNPYVRYARSQVNVQAMDGAAHISNTIVSSFDEAFRREWQHFHECVTTGAAPRTGAADAIGRIVLR